MKKIAMTATAETPWEKALMGEPKPRSLCRAQGCEKPATHVEAAHPTLLDSQRCAECATPGVHVPRRPVGKALCGAEIHDGNNDDPSYAYCGLSAPRQRG